MRVWTVSVETAPVEAPERELQKKAGRLLDELAGRRTDPRTVTVRDGSLGSTFTLLGDDSPDAVVHAALEVFEDALAAAEVDAHIVSVSFRREPDA